MMAYDLKRKYEAYYPQNFIDNKLTQAVAAFLDIPENIEKLKELNDIGIPPAFSFIFLTQSQNENLFIKHLTNDIAYNQFFGELFGAVMYDCGYKPSSTIHHNTAFLKSASIFKRT